MKHIFGQIVALGAITACVSMAQTTPTNLPSNRVPVLEHLTGSTIPLDYLDRFGLIDLNGDGITDFIDGPFMGEGRGGLGSPIPQNINIRINNGDGTWDSPQTYDISALGGLSNTNTLNSFIAEDINKDGYTDIIAVGRIVTGSVLLLNNGDTTFTQSYFSKSFRNSQIGYRENDPQVGTGSRHFLDFDGDGDLDFIMSAYDSKNIGLFLFDGTTYNETVITGGYNLSPTTYGAYIPTVADIDNDGDYDVLHVVNYNHTTPIYITVFENQNGTLSAAQNFTGAYNHLPGNVPSTADIDGDNDIDLLIRGTLSGHMEIYKNDGSNTYNKTQTIHLTGGINYRSNFEDIDGDGDMDVYFIVPGANQTLVYNNDGTGNFIYNKTDNFSYSTIGDDLNNDGYKDILSAPGVGDNAGDTEIAYVLGVGPYQFTGAQVVLNSPESYARVYAAQLDTGDFKGLAIWHTQYPSRNTNNGLSDRYEFYRNVDNDNDGLTNEQEIILGTSSINPDTDGDDIDDKQDAMNNDSDGDGVKDYDELMNGTDPRDPCNGSCTSGKTFTSSTTTGNTSTTTTTGSTTVTTGSTTQPSPTTTTGTTQPSPSSTTGGTVVATGTIITENVQTVYGETNCSNPDLDEAHAAYCFARKHGITTIDGYDNAMPLGNVYRKHFAKMMVNFSYNILGTEKVTAIPARCTQYSDMNAMDAEMQMYAQHACALGIMGVQADGATPLAVFKPDMMLTRAQFATVVSRVLWGDAHNAANNDSTNWADAHLTAMNTNGYLTYITGDRPQTNEKRVFAWIVLHRIAEKQ